MGEAELMSTQRLLVIHANLYFYGDAATETLSTQIATDVADHWNAPNAGVRIWFKQYKVRFNIAGIYAPSLTPGMVYANDNPRNNYFRIEDYVKGDISFVDGVGCNTGYFRADNLVNHSTTAAHEFGHSLGLDHPRQLNIRGKGVPGIMYPRGTKVDAAYQWNPLAALGEAGDTMSPYARKVLQEDVDALRLNRLRFNQKGFATVGDFSSVWHNKHLP